MLVKVAANRLNLPGFQDYLILGDDIVIYSKEVAEEYIKVIDSIGVEISTTKSIIPLYT